MLRVYNKIIALIVISCSFIFCTSAKAYDASVSNFQWLYPQTLTTHTGEVRFSFRFTMSPSYPVSCKYNVQLYLSKNQTLSSDDFELFNSTEINTLVGYTGFTVTITRKFNEDISLPETGTYYVFVKINPGSGAPMDTNSSNNSSIATSQIQVESYIAPPSSINVASIITSHPTGQSMIVTGDTSGKLSLYDWQGTILASRSGLGNIMALDAALVGSPLRSRLFVASEDSGGKIRTIDPADISKDIISHETLGNVTAIEVCDSGNGGLYVGTQNTGGTLYKLNNITLNIITSCTQMGKISAITQMHCTLGDILAVGSDNAGGSVYFLDKDTLLTVISPKQGLGTIYGMASADMDSDGEAELIIASSKNGGSIQIRKGPNFSNELATQNNLGKICLIDYGNIGLDKFNGYMTDAWILAASELNNGSLYTFFLNPSMPIPTLENQAICDQLGTIVYAKMHDFHTVGYSLVGAVSIDSNVPVLHLMDKNLTESNNTTDLSIEDFETNNFEKFPWVHSGNTDWTITSQENHSGLYSAKSGSISNNNLTTLQVTLNCIGGNIAFYRKVSSEPDYDYLNFYIDGQLKEQWAGEVNWEEVSFPVTAGTRTFKWTYSKDNSTSRGSDTAWIDDIAFPIENHIEAGTNEQMLANQFNSEGFVERTYTKVEIFADE